MTYIRDMFIQIRTINNKTYAIKNNDVYLLDEIAFEVWGMLDGEHTIDQIAAEISRKYKVDSRIVLRDVEEFVKELAQLKFIEVNS